jgi:hypothetical protein
MSYRHTLQAAVDSLNEIEDLVKGFPEDGHIPAVEIDLALQKLRNLYELLLLFRDMEKNNSPVQPVQPVQSVVQPPQHVQSAQSVVQSVQTLNTVNTVIEQDITEKKTENPVVEEQIIVEKKEVQIKKSRIEKNVQTLADQFKEKATLLESLHRNYNAEAVTHGKPINDIMSAIAINDRFTFIRELFNNDKAAFENAISILNNSANFNEAYNYMMQQHNWDMDSHAVQSLLDVIRRKFIKRKDE